MAVTEATGARSAPTDAEDEHPWHWDREWLRCVRAGDLAGAVEAYVRAYDWVTFPEVMRTLEPFVPGGIRGPMAITLADDPNIILWRGMSEPFVEAVRGLLGRRVWCHPGRPLTHLIDGGLLRMPLAKRSPKGGYTAPHWLPVCLRAVPLPPAPPRPPGRPGRPGRAGVTGKKTR